MRPTVIGGHWWTKQFDWVCDSELGGNCRTTLNWSDVRADIATFKQWRRGCSRKATIVTHRWLLDVIVFTGDHHRRCRRRQVTQRRASQFTVSAACHEQFRSWKPICRLFTSSHEAPQTNGIYILMQTSQKFTRWNCRQICRLYVFICTCLVWCCCAVVWRNKDVCMYV